MLNFDSINELVEKAIDGKISKIVLEQTKIDMELDEDSIINRMQNNLNIMKNAIASGLKEDLVSVSKLTGGMAFRLKSYVDSGKGISGDLVGEMMYSALAVSELNASMGKIVAAPTAGSCGILPAALLALQNHYKFDDKNLIDGLLNASGVGIVISRNATLAGAEGGCQAECGAAAAMTASAMVEIFGGTPEMCAHAIAQALKSLMGLVCDPVAGLVEEPCIIRNAGSVMIALMAAELSLSGIKSIIPADEVIEAMQKVGKLMPSSLRETAEGGLAATKTGISIKNNLFG